MVRTINESVVRAIIRNYNRGMSEGQTANLLGVAIRDVINIVYAYNCRKGM